MNKKGEIRLQNDWMNQHVHCQIETNRVDGEFIAKNPVSSFLIININTLFSPLESWPRLEAIMVEN